MRFLLCHYFIQVTYPSGATTGIPESDLTERPISLVHIGRIVPGNDLDFITSAVRLFHELIGRSVPLPEVPYNWRNDFLIHFCRGVLVSGE
jgi:hypothetical protein